MQSAKDKLATALSLHVARRTLIDSADRSLRQRFILQKQVAALRAVVLERAAPAAGGALDLFAPGPSMKALADRWIALKDTAPADERTIESAYMAIVAHTLRKVHDASGVGANGMLNKADDVLQEAWKVHPTRMRADDLASFQSRQCAAAVVAGIDPGEADRASRLDALAKRREAADKARGEAWRAAHLAQAAEFERRDALVEPFRVSYWAADEAWEKAFKEHDAGERDVPAEVQAMLSDLYAKRQAERDKWKAARVEHIDSIPTLDADAPEFAAELKAIDAEILAVKREPIDALLNASPITQEDADKWAKAQEITPSARAALKRMRYPVDEVQRDMAEFYRITGGRRASLKIRASRGARASAEGYHNANTGIINLGQNFDKRVLWHEMGHHLESDPAILAAAKGFLLRRRESAKLHTLRSLSGWKSYGPKEVAYKDSWFDVYVGKHYDHSTEVISMGIESYSSPELLAKRAAIDPEHMRLIAGLMKAQQSPLYETVKAVWKQTEDADAEAAEQAKDEREAAMQALTSSVTLEVNPPSARIPYEIDFEGTQYVGSFRNCDVYRVVKKVMRPYMGKGARRAGLAVLHYYDGRGPGSWSRLYAPFVDMGLALAQIAAIELAGDPSVGNVEFQSVDRLKQWATRIEANAAAAAASAGTT